MPHRRSKTCDFQINSKEVSRHTARIYTEDEQVPTSQKSPPPPPPSPPFAAIERPWSYDPGPPHWYQTKRLKSLSVMYAQAWLCSVGHSPVTLNGVLVESGHPALLQTGDSFEVRAPRSRFELPPDTYRRIVSTKRRRLLQSCVGSGVVWPKVGHALPSL